MKNIIICADDYGQNSAISQAIIHLVAQGRLSAVSCMVNSPNWQDHATWLKPFIGKIDIGLHFNLTEGHGLSSHHAHGFPSLPRLILKSHFYQLDRLAVAQELRAQIQAFVLRLGRMPDFIDGHQHIQQLPIIRHVLIETMQQTLGQTPYYVRSVYDSGQLCHIKKPAYLKNLIIQSLGAKSLKQLLTRLQIPHNSSFGGGYAFNRASHYPTYFRQFLADSRQNGMIMCHPGLDSHASDLIAQARVAEFDYLKSDQFLQDCQRAHASPARFHFPTLE